MNAKATPEVKADEKDADNPFEGKDLGDQVREIFTTTDGYTLRFVDAAQTRFDLVNEAGDVVARFHGYTVSLREVLDAVKKDSEPEATE